MEKNNLDLLKNKSEELQKMLNQDFEDINYDDIMNEFGVDIKGLENDMLNYKPQLSLPYKKLHPDAVTPFYNYPTDSGFDLHSINEITIPAFGRALVPTGLAFDIETGHEIQVRTKSGLAINQGLMVLNSPGTVDCFSEYMRILTVDGEKKISEIKIGEIVFSFNEETLEIEKDTISNIFNTEEQDILIIETENGVLEVTSNSEIYTKKGLKLAKDLLNDDEIIIF